MMLTENKYKRYFPIIEENKLYLDFLLQKINQYKNMEDKLPWADNALYYAVRNNAGCFVSAALENIYLYYAESLDIDSYEVRKGNKKVIRFHKICGARIVDENEIDYFFEYTKEDFESNKKRLYAMLGD